MRKGPGNYGKTIAFSPKSWKIMGKSWLFNQL